MMNSPPIGASYIEVSHNPGITFIQKMHLEFVQGKLNPLKLSPLIFFNIDVVYQTSSFFTRISMHSSNFKDLFKKLFKK